MVAGAWRPGVCLGDGHGRRLDADRVRDPGAVLSPARGTGHGARGTGHGKGCGCVACRSRLVRTHRSAEAASLRATCISRHCARTMNHKLPAGATSRRDRQAARPHQRSRRKGAPTGERSKSTTCDMGSWRAQRSNPETGPQTPGSLPHFFLRKDRRSGTCWSRVPYPAATQSGTTSRSPCSPMASLPGSART